MSKRGFTTLEAIASLFLISVVLFASITILIDNRAQANATNERLLAFQIAENVQGQVTKNVSFVDMDAWLGSEIVTIDSQTCPSSGSPINCSIFDQVQFSDLIEIIIYPASSDDLLYQVIHYDVLITYRGTRTISLGGMIYE